MDKRRKVNSQSNLLLEVMIAGLQTNCLGQIEKQRRGKKEKKKKGKKKEKEEEERREQKRKKKQKRIEGRQRKRHS